MTEEHIVQDQIQTCKGTAGCEVSVICPMYNEEIGIERSLEQLLAALNDLHKSWELILVNDGSTDRCLELAQMKLEGIPQARIVNYRTNRGRGYALRQGFAVAHGDYIITTESDLSWGAGIVAKLLKALEEQDVDMVIASPYLPGGRLENIPALRSFLSRYGNKLLSRTIPGNPTMLTGMTRGYRRYVIDALDLKADRKEIHLEIVSKAVVLGYRIGEVPAVLAWEKPEPGNRVRKSSFHGWNLIISHLLFSFSEKPFLLMSMISIGLAVSGALLLLYLAYASIALNIKAGDRPLLVIAVLMILMSGQLLVFTLLANQNRDLHHTLVWQDSKLKGLKSAVEGLRSEIRQLRARKNKDELSSRGIASDERVDAA